MVRTRIHISLFLLAAFLGSIGCNPGSIDVPPAPVTDASAYFWKNPGRYIFNKYDSVSKTASTFTLDFSTQNTGFVLSENNGSSPDTLKGNIGTQAITITGLSAHSIFPLPSGYAIKEKFALVPHTTAALAFKHILAIPDSSVLATTATAAYYSANGGRSWSQLSFVGSQDTVTVLSYIGSNVFAGTSQGNVYESDSFGASWISKPIMHFRTPVLAITADPASYQLYVSAADTLYKWSLNYSQLQRVGNNRLVKFTSLAAAIDSVGNVMVGGTASQGLWYSTDSNRNWLPVDVPPKDASINALLSTYTGFYCSTPNAIFTSVQGSSWTQLSSFTNGIFAYNAKDHKVIAANHGGSVISFDDYSHSTQTNIPQIGSKNVNDISALNANYFAATDSGIYQLFSGSVWKPIYGHGDIFTDTIKTPGEVILLQTSLGIALDSSWDATALVTLQTKDTTIITGRIVEHFDSLSTGTKTYPDVIAVRYAKEESLNKVASLPYWVIYYAKNEGPVLIRQIYGTTVMSQAVRQ